MPWFSEARRSLDPLRSLLHNQETAPVKLVRLDNASAQIHLCCSVLGAPQVCFVSQVVARLQVLKARLQPAVLLLEDQVLHQIRFTNRLAFPSPTPC